MKRKENERVRSYCKTKASCEIFGSRQILRSRVDIEYIAFGEILFEEHSSSFSSPYLFNGKELDRETNLSYFGARYYDAKVSLWLSVDPLAEKFFMNSPYIYVSQNPMNLIDPTGMGEETTSSDPPKKGNVRIVLNLGGGADIEDAATTRVNQIKKYNSNDKLIYITDDNLGNLKTNIESQIANATKEGFGKTVELSVFSHNGADGPKGYYDPNNSKDLSNDTGSQFDRGQMSPKNWANINYNFDAKKSIATFYGCSSITWAEKFMSITNVKHTAGNPGTAGGFYNTKGATNPTIRNQFGLGFGSDVFMRSFEDNKILPMYLYTRGSNITNQYGTFSKQKEVYGNPSVPNH